jgi:hypothetical protein
LNETPAEDWVAEYSLTGIDTSPKEIVPVDIARAMQQILIANDDRCT